MTRPIGRGAGRLYRAENKRRGRGIERLDLFDTQTKAVLLFGSNSSIIATSASASAPGTGTADATADKDALRRNIERHCFRTVASSPRVVRAIVFSGFTASSRVCSFVMVRVSTPGSPRYKKASGSQRAPVAPPSTAIVAPLTLAARADARNSTTAAMSSGLATRPLGSSATVSARSSSIERPVAFAFTRKASVVRSFSSRPRIDDVHANAPRSPRLGERGGCEHQRSICSAAGHVKGFDTFPPMPTTLTTAPRPKAAMRGILASMALIIGKYLLSMPRAQRSGSGLSGALCCAAPAELTQHVDRTERCLDPGDACLDHREILQINFFLMHLETLIGKLALRAEASVRFVRRWRPSLLPAGRPAHRPSRSPCCRR